VGFLKQNEWFFLGWVFLQQPCFLHSKQHHQLLNSKKAIFEI